MLLKSSLVPSEKALARLSPTLQCGGKIEACSRSYVLIMRLNQEYLLDMLSKLPASSLPPKTLLYSRNILLQYQFTNLLFASSPNASITPAPSLSMPFALPTSPLANATSKSSHTCSNSSLCNSPTFLLNTAICSTLL